MKISLAQLALLTLAATAFSQDSVMIFNRGPHFALTDISWPAAHGDAEVCVWDEDKVAALSLGVDDNCAPDHDWWLAMQQKYDFTMTWWVVTGPLEGDSNPGFNGTWSDYAELAAAGNEIASHSVTHNCEMILDEEYDMELGDSKTHIESAIPGVKVLTFAGPCGNNPPPLTLTGFGYISNRGTTGGTNAAPTINYHSTKVISSGIETVFDPAELLTPGLTTFPAEYRGWRVHFFHFVDSARDSVEQNILAPMSQHRDQLWVAPYGTVARYGQSRDTHTLTVHSVTDSLISMTLVDSMRDDLFDYHLLVKVRLNNDWTGVQATQNGNDIEAELATHGGNTYALVKVVPDRGLVTLQKTMSGVVSREVRGAWAQNPGGPSMLCDMRGRSVPAHGTGAGVFLKCEVTGVPRMEMRAGGR